MPEHEDKREVEDDEVEEKRPPRTLRRFVTRGGELVEVSGPPARETR
jgi:hypothetical protein